MTPLPVYTAHDGWFTLSEMRRLTAFLLEIDEDSHQMEAEMELTLRARRQLIAQVKANIDRQT